MAKVSSYSVIASGNVSDADSLYIVDDTGGGNTVSKRITLDMLGDYVTKLPTGGAAGKPLIKASSADYSVSFDNLAGGYVSLVTTGFNKNLGSTDNTVQKAMDTINSLALERGTKLSTGNSFAPTPKTDDYHVFLDPVSSGLSWKDTNGSTDLSTAAKGDWAKYNGTNWVKQGNLFYVLLTDAVTTDKIADANVTADKLAADAVTNAKMASNSVNTNQLVASSVTNAKLADNSVTNAKMADDSIGLAEINTATAGTAGQFLKRTASGMDWDNISVPNASIGTAKLADGSVTTPKLADNAVTKVKMADDAVGVDELETASAGTTGQILKRTSTGMDWSTDDTGNVKGQLIASIVLKSAGQSSGTDANWFMDSDAPSGYVDDGANGLRIPFVPAANVIGLIFELEKNNTPITQVIKTWLEEYSSNAWFAGIPDTSVTTGNVPLIYISQYRRTENSTTRIGLRPSYGASLFSNSYTLRIYEANVKGIKGDPGASSKWTNGTSFPPNPSADDFHLFDASVNSGLVWKDTDGTTDITSAGANDYAKFDGTNWIKQGTLGLAGGSLADGSVITSKLADGSVTTPKLADDAVTNAKVADNAIDTAQIADDAVTTDKIEDGDVTSPKLANVSVTEAKLANNAVTTNKLADNSVTKAKMADDAISSAELDTATVGSTGQFLKKTATGIDWDAITATVADGSITSAKLAADAVTKVKVADDAIGPDELETASAGSTGQYLQKTSGGMDWVSALSSIADGSITTAKLADDAVTNAKVADDAIDTAQLADDAVDTARLADDAVTQAKIADDAVGIDELKTTNTGSTGDVLERTIAGMTWVGGISHNARNFRLDTGNSFPSNPMDDDYHVFLDDVASGLVWKDTDGVTNLTSADKGDWAKYDDTNSVWVKQGNLFFVLADGGITTVKLANNAVTAPKIADKAVGVSELNTSVMGSAGQFLKRTASGMEWANSSATVADGSITTAKLADDAVTNAKVAADAIDTAQLADNAVNTARISDNAVTNAKIADDAVNSAQIADGAVTTDRIGTTAVTTPKINTGAVTEAKLASNSVTTAKIADNAVTNAKMADDSVGVNELNTASTGSTGQLLQKTATGIDWFTVGSTHWTSGNSFPASPKVNDFHLFPNNVASGLSWRDTDGTTVLARADKGDIAKYDGTNWIKQTNIVPPKVAGGRIRGAFIAECTLTSSVAGTGINRNWQMGSNLPPGYEDGEGSGLFMPMIPADDVIGVYIELEKNGAIVDAEVVLHTNDSEYVYVRDGSVTSGGQVPAVSVLIQISVRNSVVRKRLLLTNSANQFNNSYKIKVYEAKVSGGSTWTYNTAFPTSPNTNDFHIFSADVASGLVWKDTDGTTDITSANKFDFAKWNGTDWIKQGFFGGDVADGSITTAKLADNAVTKAKMADDAIGVDELETTSAGVAGQFLQRSSSGMNWVTGSGVGAGTVLTTTNAFPSNPNDDDYHFFLNDVASGLVWKDTDGTTNLTSATKGDIAQYDSTNSVWVKQGNLFYVLGTNAVTTDKINAGAVTTAKLADDSVTNDKVADGAVDTDQLVDTAVTASKIANTAVLTSKIANSAVTIDKIADDAVTNAKIADDAVSTDQLADGAVNTDRLASNAVTKVKVADDAIGVDELETGHAGFTGQYLKRTASGMDWGQGSTTILDNSVTTSKIVNDAVTQDKMADDSIGTDQLKDNAVNTARLDNNAVTKDKMADDAVGPDELATSNTGSTGQYLQRTLTGLMWATVTGGGGGGSSFVLKTGNSFDTNPTLGDYHVFLSQVLSGLVWKDTDGTTDITAASKGDWARYNGTNWVKQGNTFYELPDDSITTVKIIDDAVTNAKLADDAVDTAQLADGAVDTDRLAANAVATAKIADGAVTTVKIADNNVTNAKVADDAIDTAQLADGAVDTDRLAANAVATAKIANDAVTQAKIADDAVGTDQLADNAVNADRISANAVTTAKIADDAVTNAKIADDAVDTDQLADGAVNTARIADNAVTSAKIAADAVDSAQIADNAVTTARIGPTAVTTAKINDAAVTTGKIADDAVTNAKVADDAINTDQLADGAVDTARLADDSVTNAKIANDAVGADELNTSITGSQGQFLERTATGIDWGTVTATITDGSVTTVKLADDAVTNAKLADDAVETAQIADGAVNTARISDNAITNAKMADDSVGSDELNTASAGSTGQFLQKTGTGIDWATVTSGGGNTLSTGDTFPASPGTDSYHVFLKAVSSGLNWRDEDGTTVLTTAAKGDWALHNGTNWVKQGNLFFVLANNSVTTDKIANLNVTWHKIADRAVNTQKLGDGAVDSSKLGANAVITAKINTGAVTTVKIADDAVTNAKIADDAVATAQLADNAVNTDRIADGAVATAKIADNAVTNAKMADDSVGLAELNTSITGSAGQFLERTASGIDWGTVTATVADGSVTTVKLANDAVTQAKIADDAVGTDQLADNAVNADRLDTGAVTTAKLANDAVTNAKVADDAINTDQIADGAVNTARLADDAVTAAKIANSSVYAAQIADGVITTGKIGANAITTAKLNNDAVTNDKVADDAIDTAQLADGAVDTNRLADDAVTNAKVADDAIDTAQLADGAVDAARLDANAVTTAKIASDAVTNDKIADDAVDTAQIADDAVESAQIADDAVGSDQIADGAVTTDRIGSTAVTTAKINDSAVTTAKLADNSVTNAKMADDSIGLAEINTANAGNADQFLKRTASGLDWANPADVASSVNVEDLTFIFEDEVLFTSRRNVKNNLYDSGTWHLLSTGSAWPATLGNGAFGVQVSDEVNEALTNLPVGSHIGLRSGSGNAAIYRIDTKFELDPDTVGTDKAIISKGLTLTTSQGTIGANSTKSQSLELHYNSSIYTSSEASNHPDWEQADYKLGEFTLFSHIANVPSEAAFTSFIQNNVIQFNLKASGLPANLVSNTDNTFALMRYDGIVIILPKASAAANNNTIGGVTFKRWQISTSLEPANFDYIDGVDPNTQFGTKWQIFAWDGDIDLVNVADRVRIDEITSWHFAKDAFANNNDFVRTGEDGKIKFSKITRDGLVKITDNASGFDIDVPKAEGLDIADPSKDDEAITPKGLTTYLPIVDYPLTETITHYKLGDFDFVATDDFSSATYTRNNFSLQYDSSINTLAIKFHKDRNHFPKELTTATGISFIIYPVEKWRQSYKLVTPKTAIAASVSGHERAFIITGVTSLPKHWNDVVNYGGEFIVEATEDDAEYAILPAGLEDMKLIFKFREDGEYKVGDLVYYRDRIYRVLTAVPISDEDHPPLSDKYIPLGADKIFDTKHTLTDAPMTIEFDDTITTFDSPPSDPNQLLTTAPLYLDIEKLIDEPEELVRRSPSNVLFPGIIAKEDMKIKFKAVPDGSRVIGWLKFRASSGQGARINYKLRYSIYSSESSNSALSINDFPKSTDLRVSSSNQDEHTGFLEWHISQDTEVTLTKGQKLILSILFTYDSANSLGQVQRNTMSARIFNADYVITGYEYNHYVPVRVSGTIGGSGASLGFNDDGEAEYINGDGDKLELYGMPATVDHKAELASDDVFLLQGDGNEFGTMTAQTLEHKLEPVALKVAEIANVVYRTSAPTGVNQVYVDTTNKHFYWWPAQGAGNRGLAFALMRPDYVIRLMYGTNETVLKLEGTLLVNNYLRLSYDDAFSFIDTLPTLNSTVTVHSHGPRMSYEDISLSPTTDPTKVMSADFFHYASGQWRGDYSNPLNVVHSHFYIRKLARMVITPRSSTALYEIRVDMMYRFQATEYVNIGLYKDGTVHPPVDSQITYTGRGYRSDDSIRLYNGGEYRLSSGTQLIRQGLDNPLAKMREKNTDLDEVYDDATTATSFTMSYLFTPSDANNQWLYVTVEQDTGKGPGAAKNQVDSLTVSYRRVL